MICGATYFLQNQNFIRKQLTSWEIRLFEEEEKKIMATLVLHAGHGDRVVKVFAC